MRTLYEGTLYEVRRTLYEGNEKSSLSHPKIPSVTTDAMPSGVGPQGRIQGGGNGAMPPNTVKGGKEVYYVLHRPE